MSATMRRRRRHDRLKRVLRERRERREDALFFAKGIIPSSAHTVATCTCGAVAFSRRHDPEFNEDFRAAHSYCDDEVLAAAEGGEEL